jgi:hypothetical protein
LSKRNHNTLLTIVRSTHLARDAVLFSLFGVFSALYYPSTNDAFAFLLWLLLDLIGLILLWIPRETIQQIGCAWAIMMSSFLLFIVFVYGGTPHVVGGLIMILLLCIVELLAIIKIGYDVFIKEVRSWANDSERPVD